MLKPEDKKEIIRLIEEKARTDFSLPIIGDTPTDALQLVNRRYVNLSGTMANRPVSSTIGQKYFPTDLGYPIFANGSNWVNSVGSVVGS